MSKLLDLIEQNAIKNCNFSTDSKTMSSSSSSSSGGIGFTGLLTVLFVGLKLTGHITWPWIWVLSPIWISALIGIAILTILLIVAIVAGVFK
jgi:hypothetical protein